MKTHELKTINPYFTDVWENGKSFEVRLNDRDYKAGDHVILKEYNPDTKEYTGRSIECAITYILQDFHAIKEGYVVFGFWVIELMT